MKSIRPILAVGAPLLAAFLLAAASVAMAQDGPGGMRSIDPNEIEQGNPAEPPAAPEAKPGDEKAEPSDKAPSGPGLRERYRAARKGYQGDPGLMGMNFPRTPQEATEVLGKLFAALSTMEDPVLAGKVMGTIERIWRLPGGDTVNLLIDRASNAANQQNSELALKLLDAAVELAPDYAEAFSRRAFVYYMNGDTVRALGDLRRTLALEPNHFKALEGLAKILEETGQKKGALKALEELSRINPTTPGAKTTIENLKKDVEGQGI